MIRKVLFVVFVALGLWLVRALFQRQRRPAAGGSAGRGPASGEPMVRDRVCNTFLPRSRALSLQDGGEELYFCSEACRSTFLRARNPAAS